MKPMTVTQLVESALAIQETSSTFSEAFKVAQVDHDKREARELAIEKSLRKLNPDWIEEGQNLIKEWLASGEPVMAITYASWYREVLTFMNEQERKSFQNAKSGGYVFVKESDFNKLLETFHIRCMNHRWTLIEKTVQGFKVISVRVDDLTPLDARDHQRKLDELAKLKFLQDKQMKSV